MAYNGTINELLEAYNSLGTVPKVAKHFGISPMTARKLLRAQGIEIKHAPRVKLDPKDVAKKLDELGNLKLVSDYFGLGGHETVARYLEKHGLRKRDEHLHETLKHNFFSSDTSQSFYLAGLLAADGCITGPKNNRIELSLWEPDKELMEDCKKLIGITLPLRQKSSPLQTCPKYGFSFCSDQVTKDLKKFNIQPRKARKIEFPHFLNNHPLLHFFVRGLFDGDGSAYYRNNDPNCALIWSISGNVPMIQGLQDGLNACKALGREADRFGKVQPMNQKLSITKKGCAKWAVKGETMAFDIFLWMYQDILSGNPKAPFMKRKFLKFWETYRDRGNLHNSEQDIRIQKLL